MSDQKGRNTMFRRKDESAQEELDMASGSQSEDKEEQSYKGTSSAQASGGSGSSGGGAGSGQTNRPASGQASSGYRPAQSAPAVPRAAQPARPAQTQPVPATGGGATATRAEPSQVEAAKDDASAASSEEGRRSGSSHKNSKRILTVGNDILLKGEIATCDRLVIEGMVDATLKDVHTVEISETGSFKGAAEIQDAEISGLFEGDLIVRNRLTIYGSGKVRGKISYGEIEIERGGEMTGEIRMGAESSEKSNGTEKSQKDQKVA